MAEPSSKRKKPFIRLELGLGGFLGLAVVIFCVFFWMFLLGIWAGQTILQPNSGRAPTSAAIKEIIPRQTISSWWSGARQAVTGTFKPKPHPPEPENGNGDGSGSQLAAPAVESGATTGAGSPESPAVASAPEAPAPAKEVGPLVFTLQVGSFKSETEAREAVLAWRTSGQEAYLGLPDQEAGDGSWRVLIGKYRRLNDANAAAGLFEEQENTRAFIAQVPEAKLKAP